MGCSADGSGGYSTKTKNPIDFATGNKFFHATDYRGSGSFPIVFDRSYNSLLLGWRYAYTQRIERLADDLMVVRRPGGQSYEFSLSGGQWLPDPDVTDRLEAQTAADGSLTGWHYTTSSNRQERFDAVGRLMSIRNAAGMEQTLTYSAEGSQFTITDPHGDSLQVTLNSNGLSARSIKDSQGRTTFFQYNDFNLARVTYPNGTSKQYLYEVPERPWLITGIIDENGNRSNSVEYDAQGRAIMSELADGVERVEVSYNADGTTTLTNALGKKTRFEFITQHGVRKIVHVEGEPTQTCQGSAMDYRFDDNGFLIEKTDAKGIVTQFTRDTHGQVLSKTEAAGLPEARTVTTKWDSERRLPLLVTEANRETHYLYDTQGRTLERTVIDSSSGSSRTTRYSYNPQGLLESVDGPREDVVDISHYDYDAQGKLARVTNALGHVTTIVNRDPSGRPITTRDANGLESQLVYNDSGKLIERRISNETTAMSYDAVGNLLSVTTATGDTLSYRYDAANRLIGIEDATGNRIAYTLDAMNNRTSEQVFDNGNQLISTQQKIYDELSRLLKSVGANGQDTTYGYDRNNNLTSTIDPLWRVHESAYDGLNRLIEQTDPATGVTSYGYDIQGQLSLVTDPNGNSTRYVYDALGNLLEQHSPDTGTTTFSHDAAGNVIRKTDNSGNVTTYQYDALNRLIVDQASDGSEVRYLYDSAENGIGRLAQLIDSSGETHWRYDAHGRTTQRQQTISIDGISQSHTTAWQYNSAGQLTGMTYPSGMQLGYQYRDGKISALTLNGEPLLSAISYRPFGPISGWQWANGSQHQRAYNQDGQLTKQSLGNTERQLNYDAVGNLTTINEAANQQLFTYDELNRLIAANDATINLAWLYDANGNRIGETDHDITTPYSIDSTSNRLLTQGTSAYEYDSNGHLINDGEHSYHYNTRLRLTHIDEGETAYYRYNALGQRVYKWGMMKNGATPDLNGDGVVTEADIHRLHEIIQSGEAPSGADLNGDGSVDGKDTACIATLIGDSKSQGNEKEKETKDKVEKTQGVHACLPPVTPQERLFVYDEHRLLGEYDKQGNVVQETVWLGNLPVATVQNGNTYAIHTDHLGTPRVITDNSNIEVWTWESDPFGVAAANDDSDGDGVKFTYNLRFPGQYYDAETGRHYNYFRDYDPSTGRYIESDPIGLEGGMNTYAYVGGNPIMRDDALGLAYPISERYPNGYPDEDMPQCEKNCFASFIGVETASGTTAVVAGQPWVPYPRSGLDAPSSTGKTSVASKWLRKLTRNKKLTRIPTPTKAGVKVGTASVGGAMGRFVPFVGYGVLGYEYVKLLECLADCDGCKK
jgi:RHS repeat-associated protein